MPCARARRLRNVRNMASSRGDGTCSPLYSDFRDLFRVNKTYLKRTVAMSRVMLEKRYSGSALGFGWAIVKPTLFIFVFWFAVALGIRGSSTIGEIPFILWLIPGIIPWNHISDSITQGGSSIRQNNHLVTKMVYPVATIPVSTVLSIFYVHLLMMMIVTAIFVLSGFGITVYFVQLPYYMAACLIFTVVVATLLSALTAISRDFNHLIKATINALFWLSPSCGPAINLDGLLRAVVMANPIAYIIQGYRNCFVNEVWFFDQWQYGLYFWGFMLASDTVHELLVYEAPKRVRRRALGGPR